MTTVLREYRQITENGAQICKNLSKIRILSLSYIFLISDKDHCSLFRLLLEQQLSVMKDLNLKQYLEFMEDDVLIACRKMQKPLYNEYMNEEEIEDAIDLKNNSSNSIHIKTAVKITKDIIPDKAMNPVAIARQCTTKQHVTLSIIQIIELLRPFLLHYWTSRLTGVKYEWLTYHLFPPPQHSSFVLLKIANPEVVGLLIKEDRVATASKMDLKCNGQYRMTKISEFNFIRKTSDDILLLSTIMEKLAQIKEIISSTLKNLYESLGNKDD
ncbi:MAG: hypothetical protein EXX96DRAFT_536300 [Benjaminiella poitrasii]|nr:MAG: hypothetical protein EXX96DRAFT_536300 [Benjaminiella poitrasii]